MGLLDNAGQAAQGVTDKATDNPVAGMLDAVADGLNPSAGADASDKAHYLSGAPLSAKLVKPVFPVKPVNLGEGPQEKSSVPLQVNKPLQFIHLSFAHDDLGATFPGKAGSRGLAFRDALLREDVLLYSFARAAQRVLEQAKTSKGAAGAMLEVAGSLLGGSKTAAAGPESIDPILNQIRSAGDAVNVEAPDYPTVHASGIKLAEAWANFNQTCKRALDPKQSGGLGLPSIPGLSALAGGAGIPDVVAKIPEWLFKVQDAYQGMYSAARATYEWDLMKACHDYSISAIQNDWRPSYDIWFLRTKRDVASAPADDASMLEQTLQGAQDSLNALPPIGGTKPGADAANSVKGIQDSITDARTSAGDTASDITGWLATAESEQAQMPDGSAAALAQALAVLNGNAKAEPPLPDFSSTMARGLATGLGMGSLPTFLQIYVDKISDIALVLLPRIYTHLHGRYGVPEHALVLAAVHDAVASRIVDLVWTLIFPGRPPAAHNDAPAMQKSGKSFVDAIGHGDLGTGGLPGVSQLENKAADLVRGFIRDQGHYVDCVIDFVAEDLYNELVEARNDCAGRDVLSMEIHLGRLPMLAALLTRNLVFPVFNLVLQVFGLGDKFAGMAWDPVKSKLAQAGKIADTVQDTKNDVRQGGQDVAAGAKRAEDEIGRKQNQIGDDVKDLTSGGSVTDMGSAERLAGQKGQQATDLTNDIGSTPDDVMNAASKKAGAADLPSPQPAGKGPISVARKTAGEAAPLKPGDVDKAGRVSTENEEQAIHARQAPAPPAPATPAGPKLPF